MKKALAAFFVLLFLAPQTVAASPADGNIYFQIPIKILHEEPSEESPVKFEIPIDVVLLGVTPDKNWYKVSIAYDLVFLGRYEYTGWVKAPMAKYLLQGSQPSGPAGAR